MARQTPSRCQPQAAIAGVQEQESTSHHIHPSTTRHSINMGFGHSSQTLSSPDLAFRHAPTMACSALLMSDSTSWIVTFRPQVLNLACNVGDPFPCATIIVHLCKSKAANTVCCQGSRPLTQSVTTQCQWLLGKGRQKVSVQPHPSTNAAQLLQQAPPKTPKL